ncbi:MAG TPA: undecaprenyldiphospho-muramoylpentapeptide beta-N-acetylglucosaminyltransferase [Candidatus Binataceae bacterium]|nr:undecaprenyldiphospho-muramoylpentapeptide beta-N-acetylglucosaminyltransferase [Candidatus Binataceae bacterium]
MRVIIAGGGTGGHLFPAVALGEEIVRERPESQVLFVGTTAGMEAKWLAQNGFAHELFQVHGMRGHSLRERARALVEFFRALGSARALLRRYGPNLVVGAGGYASAPMAMAAIIKRVPLLLMEQNTRPGLANRILWRFADRLCVGFAETANVWKSPKVEVTGNPIRFAPQPMAAPTPDQLQILVLGGSSGAHRLNLGAVKCFQNLEKGVIKSLWHQTGAADEGLVKMAYQQAGIEARVTPFIDDMAPALAHANLIIARAGAMTVSEIALAARPAIFVPYPFHRDRQQEHNARVIEKLGGAIVIRDDDQLAENLARTIRELAADPARLSAMGPRAAAAAFPDAAQRVARACFEIADSRSARA